MSAVAEGVQALVRKAFRESPAVKGIVATVEREIDERRATARQDFERAETQGAKDQAAARAADEAAEAKVEAAIRALKAAEIERLNTYRRRSDVGFAADNAREQTRKVLEALAPPEIHRFVVFADELVAAICAAPLPGWDDQPPRHKWFKQGSDPAATWSREKALREGVMEQLRAARDGALELRLSGAPQAETRRVLGARVRELRKAAREVTAVRHLKSMQDETDVLAEPEVEPERERRRA